jgi:hypothetical protein
MNVSLTSQFINSRGNYWLPIVVVVVSSLPLSRIFDVCLEAFEEEYAQQRNCQLNSFGNERNSRDARSPIEMHAAVERCSPRHHEPSDVN